MKVIAHILLFCILIFASGHKGFAQGSVQLADSLRIKEKKMETAAGTNARDQKGTGNMQQTGKGQSGQQVKRIKSGRPDMSRARGARPPSVVRPSGSGIPRGVGKPGGVGRKVGR